MAVVIDSEFKKSLIAAYETAPNAEVVNVAGLDWTNRTVGFTFGGSSFRLIFAHNSDQDTVYLVNDSFTHQTFHWLSLGRFMNDLNLKEGLQWNKKH
jgi:hypothetical protein